MRELFPKLIFDDHRRVAERFFRKTLGGADELQLEPELGTDEAPEGGHGAVLVRALRLHDESAQSVIHGVEVVVPELFPGRTRPDLVRDRTVLGT